MNCEAIPIKSHKICFSVKKEEKKKQYKQKAIRNDFLRKKKKNDVP